MSRGDLGSDDPTDLGYCLPVVAPCSLRMILSWRYNVLDGPSGFWSPDMLNTLNTCMAETSRSFRWFRLPFEDDHFIHHDHIPFCTVELNRMQLVSQVQPDILIHALFMQHNGKQKLNQIIHSIWGDTGEYNRFVFEVPGLCCFCCACLPAHPMTVTPSAWIEVGALIVYVAARLCHQAFVKSIEAIGLPPPRGAHFELDGFDFLWGAIIDVYNLCDTRGKLMLPNIWQVFKLFIHNLLAARILQLECVKLDRFGILHLQIDTCTSKPSRTWNRPFVSWLDHVGSRCKAIFLVNESWRQMLLREDNISGRIEPCQAFTTLS